METVLDQQTDIEVPEIVSEPVAVIALVSGKDPHLAVPTEENIIDSMSTVAL